MEVVTPLFPPVQFVALSRFKTLVRGSRNSALSTGTVCGAFIRSFTADPTRSRAAAAPSQQPRSWTVQAAIRCRNRNTPDACVFLGRSFARSGQPGGAPRDWDRPCLGFRVQGQKRTLHADRPSCSLCCKRQPSGFSLPRGCAQQRSKRCSRHASIGIECQRRCVLGFRVHTKKPYDINPMICV